MKVLQTLGRHRAVQEGIFQYRRDVDGVYIDSSVGRATLTPAQVLITRKEWTKILRAMRNSEYGTFRLTGTAPFDQPPNQSLYELISDAVPSPEGGWTWNDSFKSYVCAILEHEGSIDLYHGVLGPGNSAIICLARDT